MNPVLTLAHNNLALTRRALASAWHQDIPCVEVFVVDNDSNDGTTEWLQESAVPHATFRPQLGVSAGWNYGLRHLFDAGAEHVLVINNDVRLPNWFYRSVLLYDYPLVTGRPVDVLPGPGDEITIDTKAVTPNPCFSAFLIRRTCWAKVGKFDENMKLYASDCDYHARAHRVKVPLVNSNLPFYHEVSSTMKNASGDERAAIQRQADADRDAFRAKYNCLPGDEDYAAMFRGAESLLTK